MFPFFFLFLLTSIFSFFAMSKYYVRIFALVSPLLGVLDIHKHTHIQRIVCSNCHHNIQQLLDWISGDWQHFVCRFCRRYTPNMLFIPRLFFLFISSPRSTAIVRIPIYRSAVVLDVGTSEYLLHFSAISQSIDVYNFQIYTRKYLTGIRIVLTIADANAACCMKHVGIYHKHTHHNPQQQ